MSGSYFINYHSLYINSKKLAAEEREVQKQEAERYEQLLLFSY